MVRAQQGRTPSLDYDLLVRQVVRAMRGRRSQATVNRRLAYRTNVISTWEQGRREPTLVDVLRLAKTVRIDVAERLEAFFSDRNLSWARDRKAGIEAFAHAVFQELAKEHAAADLASAIGARRATVARWLKGDSSPKFSQLLRIANACSYRLCDFVEIFAEPRQVPEIAPLYETLQRQRQVAYDMPWSHAVLRAMELTGYRKSAGHGEAFLVETLGTTEAVVRESIAALAAASALRRDGERWVPAEVLAVDTQKDAAGNLRLKEHWAHLALERMTAGSRPRNLFSYNLFAISEQGLARIEALHRAYFEQVRDVVEACTEPTRVAVINVQLFDLAVDPQTSSTL